MSGAALVLGSVGVVCLFAPDLVLASVAGSMPVGAMVVVQVLGTLSLGLAVLDWMWKKNRLGGIYGRPIVLANALHFVSASLVMGKALTREPVMRAMWPLAVAYAIFGAAFLVLIVRDPTETTRGGQPSTG